MTQEEKELLRKVLCEMLPYGVKVRGIFLNYNKDKDRILYEECDNVLTYESLKNNQSIRPYLRPMSSMTEEEKEELSKRYVFDIVGNKISIRYHCEGYWDDDTECSTQEYIWLFDWCNKKHLDYRGLIPMDLALPAPEGMYNFKNE